jgi:hypothetical protein
MGRRDGIIFIAIFITIFCGHWKCWVCFFRVCSLCSQQLRIVTYTYAYSYDMRRGFLFNIRLSTCEDEFYTVETICLYLNKQILV